MSGEGGNVSSEEDHVPRRQKHRGGKVNSFEPQDTVELNASPMIITCFQNVGCFQFCERVQQVQS